MSAALAVDMKKSEPSITVILKPSFQLTVGKTGLSVAVRAVHSENEAVGSKPRGHVN
jgi:hypothetical protein